MSPETLDAILERYDRNPAQLIPILQDVQAEENYLPREALEAISEKLDIPLVRIYSVATFYKAFSLEAPPASSTKWSGILASSPVQPQRIWNLHWKPSIVSVLAPWGPSWWLTANTTDR